MCSAGSFLAPAVSYAYRTGEDSTDLSGRGRVAWTAARVGFTLSERELPAGVSKSEMEQALAMALDAWKAPACTAVEPYFAGWTTEEPASRDGVSTIAWIADWAKRGYPAQSPGYTDMQYRGHDGAWEIADADVYLDATSYDWTITTDRDTSLPAVLTHELGHALGLLHPCELDAVDGAPACTEVSADELATTMYPLYSAEQASPEADDLAGICYLYPVAGACVPGCGTKQECIDGECRALCGDGLCRVGEVCGHWGCAPENSCTERLCTGRACDGDGACGPLATCEQGMCVAGQVPWGSACNASRDCSDGACVDHVCQPPCRNDTECGLGKCAAAVDAPVRGCVSSRSYDTGLRCVAGEDCKTGLCLTTESPAVCTVECRNETTCPDHWSCRGVDGHDVCVPASYNATGGGCALGSPWPGGADRYFWLLAAAGLALRWQARSRRSAP